MFHNLYFLEPEFADFNFCDFLGRFEKVGELYVKARLEEQFRREQIEPYFWPIIPLTLQSGSCGSFLRAHSGLPITDRDYYLSKLFQFLYLAITIGFALDFNGAEVLRGYLEDRLDKIPDDLLPQLHLFDWQAFLDDVTELDQDRSLGALPKHFPERIASILTEANSDRSAPALYSENRLASSPAKTAISGTRPRGRPPIPVERKELAFLAKSQGKSNRECAQLLYQAPYPTNRQIKDVPTILRYYSRTRRGHESVT